MVTLLTTGTALNRRASPSALGDHPMNHYRENPPMTSLVAGQIVFLECRQTRLYAEVIQVLETRPMGWVRPLALVSGAVIHPLGGFDSAIAKPQTTPDMVWPLDELQPALDTDAIPLLAQLSSQPSGELPLPELLAENSHRLTVNEFVRLLWADSRAKEQGKQTTSS